MKSRWRLLLKRSQLLAGLCSLLLLASLLFTSGAGAQGTSISLNDVIPPVPVPPKISSVSDTSLVAGTNDVTVTATATTYAAVLITENPDKSLSGTFQTTPDLTKANLCYSFDYKTADPPTWTCNPMTFSLTQDNTSSTTWPNKVYSLTGTIPGQAEGTTVTYIIEGEDSSTNSDAGMGHSAVVFRRTPANGPGIGSSWKDADTSLVGELSPPSGSNDETQAFCKPPKTPCGNPMSNDLDVLDLRIANGGATTNKLYARMKVQGTISAGSSDLSAANGYVIAVVNAERPPIANPPNPANSGDAARGIFALLWFPNASQTGGALPTNPMLADAEASANKTCGQVVCPAGQASNPLVSRAPADPTGVLTLLTDFSNVQNVTADKNHPLYDKSFIILAATAVIDGSDLQNIKFTINDVTNATRYYPNNFSYTVAVCTTCPTFANVTLNFQDAKGSPVTISGTATLYEGTSTTPTSSVSLSSASSVTFNQLDTKKTFRIEIQASGFFTADATPDISTSAGQTKSLNLALYDAASGGDVNLDGKVDRTDLDTVIQNYNKTSFDPKTDLNGDGKVTLLDIGTLLRNYGKQANP